MLSSLKLQPSCPPLHRNSDRRFHNPNIQLYDLRLRNRRFSSLSVQSQFVASEPSFSLHYTESVGSSSSFSPPLSRWNFSHRHIVLLNVIACATAISATWLFCSAIPTLLAFKRAAESLERLMDVTREELPDTMAAIRLSGMEISDLTMELSDLGQEITQGVRSSTRAVRLAEERLRGLTNMAPSATVQEVCNLKTKAKRAEPALATSARGIREGIVKGRSIFQILLTFTRFSQLALNYLINRSNKKK